MTGAVECKWFDGLQMEAEKDEAGGAEGPQIDNSASGLERMRMECVARKRRLLQKGGCQG